MTAPDNAISLSNLVKTYAPRGGQPAKQALKGISLDIPRGSFFGLLGPNGAGKSTLINIMAGLVVKTSGSVKIWDRDLDTDARGTRMAIGVVPQEVNFDPFFPPRELLELQAGLYGVPPAERKTMEILTAVGLKDKANAPSRTLSGGMRRRLLVAKAMVHSPPILVLDEPTAGVDIELRHQLWEHIKEMNRRGVTIVLTTHYLEEAEALCDRIAIIDNGAVVACDTTQNLLHRLDNKTLRVVTRQAVTHIPEALARFEVKHADKGHGLSITYHRSTGAIAEILAVLTASGLDILDLSTDEANLEDIFLKLTGTGAAA